MKQRKEILSESKTLFKQELKATPVLEFAFRCYEQPEREWHQLAVDYVISLKKTLPADSIPDVERLLCTHSWWDTVDMLAIHTLSK